MRSKSSNIYCQRLELLTAAKYYIRKHIAAFEL